MVLQYLFEFLLLDAVGMLHNDRKFDYRIFAKTAIDFHFHTLQAWWANVIVLAVTVAGVHNYVTSHTEVLTTWSVDCVNQIFHETNIGQTHTLQYTVYRRKWLAST